MHGTLYMLVHAGNWLMFSICTEQRDSFNKAQLAQECAVESIELNLEGFFLARIRHWSDS